MGPGIYFFHSAALPSVYLSPCVYLSLALIWINTIFILKNKSPYGIARLAKQRIGWANSECYHRIGIMTCFQQSCKNFLLSALTTLHIVECFNYFTHMIFSLQWQVIIQLLSCYLHKCRHCIHNAL